MFIEKQPDFYTESGIVKNIQSGIEVEYEKLQIAMGDFLNQIFVGSASWGIDRWEKMFGIPIDKNEPIENRRAQVMLRMRGQGTTTKEMIKNVCEAFAGCEVQVIEDNANYKFTVKFVGMLGIPGNLNYLSESLNEIKPAHLSFDYEFTYNTYNSLSKFTYDQLKQFTYDELRSGKLGGK